MNYAVAMKYAESVARWLSPFCERVEIAGSVRRRRPMCGDLDLVVIPKEIEHKDLFGVKMAARNLLKEELDRYVKENSWRGARWGAENVSGAERFAADSGAKSNFILQLLKCQLDVFCATTENFGAVLFTRTGSKEHNIWIAQWAQKQGLSWSATRGVKVNGEWIGEREDLIFRALGLEFIEPERREI